MAYPFKVVLGYFTDAETQRHSVRVGITNTSTAPFNRVELAWVFQVPDNATRQLRTVRLPFSYAAGVQGQPLPVGQTHTFVIPPDQFFEVNLLVQGTPPEAHSVVADIDGKEMLVVRGQDFERLVLGCYPQEGRPEVDVAPERVDFLTALAGTIMELAQPYKIHPPKEVTNDPSILESDEVAMKLDGTKWWLRFAHGREELLDFRELMVLTYNVFIMRNRLTHQFLRGNASGIVNISVTMAVPYVMTKDGVRSLLRRLTLEGVQR